MSLSAPGADRAVLITGASAGIGAAFAREFARRGHQVVLVARSADKLTALADELNGQGVRAEVLPLDLCDRDARAGLPDRVAAMGLTVDILVNNAGLTTMGPIARSDPDAELKMIELDVVAVADLCSRLVPGMVARGRGGVINVASLVAFLPTGGQAGYCASKSFVLSYTQCLAAELRGTGVSATVVSPGPVDTEFATNAGFDAEDTGMVPKFMWEKAGDVAKSAVDSLDRGRTVNVPGLGNKASTLFGQLVPDRVLVPLLSRFHPAMRD